MKKFVEKLIERLENEILQSTEAKAEAIMGMCGASANACFGEVEAYNKAIEIVKDLASEHNNGWIPCSERLPDIGERVFVWVYGRVCIGKRIDAKLFEEYDIFSLENGSNESTKRIDAWQPLPAPYQPKGE